MSDTALPPRGGPAARTPAPDQPGPLPVRAPLVTQPLGLFGSLAAARRNVLTILPEIATRQPIVSGKMGVRWHMLMDPDAIRRVLPVALGGGHVEAMSGRDAV